MSKALMPPTSGDFYAANKSVQHLCARCGSTHRLRPRVAAYNAKLDHGGAQASKHPDWPKTGWLALWRCDGYHYEVVHLSQVVKWGAELGGWHHE